MIIGGPLLLIKQTIKLNIYILMVNVKASHNSAKVQLLYGAYFSLVISEVEVRFDIVETTVVGRANT